MTQDRAAFAGQIADVPVVELLQTILQGLHTGIARFDTPSGAATLWFRDGALVDADMGRHHMEAAVQRLLALEDGAFEIEFKPINRRQVIKLGTAELIAQAPAHPSAQEDTDPRNKRPRRQGVSWHPTGGGRPTSSGSVPIVPPPTSSGAVPIVSAPVSSAAAASLSPAAAAPPLVMLAPAPEAPIAVPTSSSAPIEVAVASPTIVPPVSAPLPMAFAPSNGTPEPIRETTEHSRGRTMFGLPTVGTAPTSAPIVVPSAGGTAETPRAPTTGPHEALPPSATMVGAARLGLEATIPPLVASAAARRHEGAKDEVIIEAQEVGDRTWMRPFSPPGTLAAETAPSPAPRQPADPSRPTTPAQILAKSGKTQVPTTREPAPGVTTTFFPAPNAEGQPVSVWPELPATTERTPVPVVIDDEEATVREETKALATTQPHHTMVGAAIVRGGPSPTPLWQPPAMVPAEAGALVRAPFVPMARPGSQRRIDERVADIAQAIGLQPLPIASGPPQDPRAVADGVRLDQQVEAARAAGLTGASAPALVGRYEVLLRIARGGMGTVYLARITGEGGFRRLFALKVIRDHLSQNDEYVRMLLQEARIASRLHHPNVVGIVDIGTLANQHYLVMDYVEGCTFSELLKVHRRTRPAHLIVPIMLDALTGLHAAHTLVDDDGVPLTLVHCDFSPQNMLLGTNGICRITDFGIARATNAWHERSSITRGKPAYVSPEQVIGRPLDRRSDVFSAGVVLWNALTGEQLFDGDTPERTLNAVLNKPIPAPSTVGLRPPSCFDRVCQRALLRDPDRRYQSAEEMLIELRRIAIAEDYLAPSSEVAQWVIDTFGRQLELRRQAAGISSRGLGDSQPVLSALAVPELSFLPVRSNEQTAETSVLPEDYPSPDYSTPIDDSHPSRTALIRSEANFLGETRGGRDSLLSSSRARAFMLGIAVTIATTALAIGIAKPEWIGGGAVDDYGRYVAPAAGTSAMPGDGEKATPSPAKTSAVKPDAPVQTPTEPPVEAKIEGAPEPMPPKPEVTSVGETPTRLGDLGDHLTPPEPVAEKRPKKIDAKPKTERRLEKKKPPEDAPAAEPTEDVTPQPEPATPTPTPTPEPPPPPEPRHEPPVDPFAPSKDE